MQIRIVDVSDEIKLRFTVETDGLGVCVDVLYQGAWGYEDMQIDFYTEKTVQDVHKTALQHAKNDRAMASMRANQEIAKCFQHLVREHGLHQTIRDIEKLPALVRVRHNGETYQATHEPLPFPYDQIPEAPEALNYTTGGSWFYFDLTQSGDQVAFGYRGHEGSPFRHHGDMGAKLREFAVKRLYEIYRNDQGKQHLAWVSDLMFAGDLGL